MGMIAVYKKNLDGTLSLINKEMGNETDDRKSERKGSKNY